MIAMLARDSLTMRHSPASDAVRGDAPPGPPAARGGADRSTGHSPGPAARADAVRGDDPPGPPAAGGGADRSTGHSPGPAARDSLGRLRHAAVTRARRPLDLARAVGEHH